MCVCEQAGRQEGGETFLRWGLSDLGDDLGEFGDNLGDLVDDLGDLGDVG